ncbi:DEAD/DEAH box helicase [Humibacillus xanthopallidus]|uniref:Helicase-like protein n=1 Tax=Humibacillus xanthopallidus TaxID=412689 RepID=A0A543HGE8_9MICO|nr:DEAD/DEAH box helicase [Humibacillus xanthopallidus]TQM57409.1 helicase-like protein [Humibacillus xanthopallidus]
MAWSVGRATWVATLSDPEIAQQVGSRTFDRGVGYAAEARVRSLASRPDGLMLLGTIEGSGSETYQTIIEARPHPKGRSHLWSGRCSCPVGTDCKHTVALLLVARDIANGIEPRRPSTSGEDGGQAGEGASGSPVLPPAAGRPGLGEVHWSELLGHVTPRVAPTPGETRVRPEPRGDLMPAGLFVDTIYREPRGARGSGSARPTGRSGGLAGLPVPGYGLRPTRWTRAGAWHRTLSWHDALPQWRAGIRLLPEHERILSRIHDATRHGSGSTTYFTPVPPISLDASPDIWPLLVEALDAGVEIMPGEGVVGPVAVAREPATLTLAVLRADDGSGDLVLRVVTEGLPDVQGEVLHLGDPVHGIAVAGDDGSLTLVPLDQDLELSSEGLIQALVGMRVPAAERARFLGTTVPGLRQRVRVRSQVPLPAPEPDGLSDSQDAGDAGFPGLSAPGWQPPAVTVHVTVGSDMPGEVRLDLGFAYDGTLRPFTAQRFGGALGGRDRDAELEALRAASSLDEVPGATRGDRDGPYALAPLVVLRGIAAATFVPDVLPVLEADPHVTVEIDGELPDYEEVTSAPIVHLGAVDRGPGASTRVSPGSGGPAETGDWFDLHVTIEVEGEEVPFEPLFGALARGEEVMFLDSGSWFRLDRPELHRLRALIDEARELADPESGGLRLSAHHADLWDELVALGVVDEQSARWAANVEALGSLDDGPVAEVPPDLRATLRPYQLDGFRWLARLWDARIGGILADDMGLGKTMQVIAAIARGRDRGEVGGDAGPVLVIAPTTVVGTWMGELATFAPHLSVVAVTATERKRGVPLADEIVGAEVVISSYAVLRLDDSAFHSVRWSGVVLDEAQFVKNRQAKTHVAVRKLGAPFTIAVTGTPLENSLMDLWSLLSLTAPGLYPRPDVFTKNYRKPIESGQRPELLDLLRRRIRPLMLRRTKEQVAIDLPPKQIQVLPLEPHPVHRHIYDRHLQRERQRVLGLLADPESNRVAILAALTRLRQLALDPALVDPAHAGKATPAKVDFLVDQLRELAAEGHRALVFSQFTGFLRGVEAALARAGLHTAYLDGSTTDRQSVVDDFRQGDAVAFLISLKAGGFGLTLTEADYVFVLDPWWNPAAEAQAIDRAHRIGQSRPVTVYRLVSAGTIEEKVVALQDRKRDLFQRVVDDGGSLSGAITADDVRDLIGLA